MLKAVCSNKNLEDSDYYQCIADLIDRSELEPLKEITHHIASTRFQHCVNVSYYCYIICKVLKLDARSAARAGLLHDLFYYDRKKYNAIRRKYKNRPSHSHMHSIMALNNASKLTNLNQLEKDIIYKHMWPVTKASPKYKETYIITTVDKVCAVFEFLAIVQKFNIKIKTVSI